MTGIPPPVPSTAGHASQALVRGHLAGAAASAAFALAWLGLLRARLRHPARRGHALVAVGGGFLIAMAALGIAVAAGWLRGPTLIGAGSVPVEEVALAVVAAAWGWRVAERRRRARFLPAEPSRPDGRPASPAEPASGEWPPEEPSR